MKRQSLQTSKLGSDFWCKAACMWAWVCVSSHLFLGLKDIIKYKNGSNVINVTLKKCSPPPALPPQCTETFNSSLNVNFHFLSTRNIYTFSGDQQAELFKGECASVVTERNLKRSWLSFSIFLGHSFIQWPLMTYLTSIKPAAKAVKEGLLFRGDTASKLSLSGETNIIFWTGNVRALWM